MAQEKWALRPGEKTLTQSYVDLHKETLEKKFTKLVEEYVARSDRRLIVLDDNKEIVYFINYNQNSEEDAFDVAVYDGNEYTYISEELARSSTEAYLAYVEAIADVYDQGVLQLRDGTT